MTFITGRSLSRRTVLRGLGAAVALPFLDAMVPAVGIRGQSVLKPIQRFQTVYVPNGMAMPYWSPEGEGKRLAVEIAFEIKEMSFDVQ